MQVLKDAGGKWSYSRITGMVIVVANLVASLKAVWLGSPEIPDIPINWAMLAAGLYGLNIFKNRDQA